MKSVELTEHECALIAAITPNQKGIHQCFPCEDHL